VPLGRRTAKYRLGADGSPAEAIYFTWDGTRLAEQTDADSGVTLTWDHEGHKPLTQLERKPRASDDFTQDEYDSRFFAIVTDLVGTPTELVDETGHIAWHSRTTLWGTTTRNRDATAYTPLRFPGQYEDPETALHYNYFRHYDPETARYTTPDPLGLTPAPNPVTYTHNPHTWTDVLGLAPESCTSGNVTVYRKQTDHPMSQRVHVGENGEVTITGKNQFYVNMSGDIRHTTEFRGDGGQIVAFDVSSDFREQVRREALPQEQPANVGFTDAEWKQVKKLYPEISDPTKGNDLYGIPGSMLGDLRQSIVPGSGRVVQEG
jgi:RHS repeat-associated protein